MALVTDVVKRVEIAHEPGEWMKLKKLSRRQLEQASDVQSDAIMERMKKIGGDLIAAFRATADEQKQDPFAGYDLPTVLKLGIAEWSYSVPVDSKNLDELDEETADWAFREILTLSKSRTEAETKNA